ncbi:2-acylglycerol O-acyltransferase 1 isoform X2 [Leptinotarsa decemlineata]
MQILGIRFAPLSVPMNRRLQTLATAAWMFTITFGAILGFVLAVYLVLYWKYWWLIVIYLFWVWVVDKDISECGGRPRRWVRKWVWWRYLRDYFPLHLEKVPFVELDPKRNYLFCAFPHGILSTSAFSAFASEYSEFRSLFPAHDPRVVTLAQHYHVPFYRDLALSLGGISASAKSIDYVLSRPQGGHICVLMVGGAAEAYYCKPGNYKVILRKRKGFVKLALKNGTPLVPVISFGETDLFDQVEGPILNRIQERIRRWIGFAPVVIIGRGFFQYSFGIIPRRCPVTTVVGRPLDVPKIENPSHEQVEEYHRKFMQSLTDMFEEQKYNYLENPEEKKLEIL